jgi:hypothetical protein
MGKSGHHREDGIFLARGPAVRAGLYLEGARIIDLAPTILHVLGVPAPADMDGRVLEEIFTPAGRLPLEAQPAAAAPPEAPGDGYSAADEAAIAARLKALGYVE